MREAGSCARSRTRAAGGRSSPATRRRSKPWCARSRDGRLRAATKCDFADIALGVRRRRPLSPRPGRRSLDSDGCANGPGLARRYPIISVRTRSPRRPRGHDALHCCGRDTVQIIGDDYLHQRGARKGRGPPITPATPCCLNPPVRNGHRDARGASCAKAAGWGCIVSAGAGETRTEHRASGTGWDAGQLKVGSFARGERMAKWNKRCASKSCSGGRAFRGSRSATVEAILGISSARACAPRKSPGLAKSIGSEQARSHAAIMRLLVKKNILPLPAMRQGFNARPHPLRGI